MVSTFDPTQVQPDGSWTCTATVLPVGTYNMNVTWSNGADDPGVTPIVLNIVDPAPPPPPPAPDPPSSPPAADPTPAADPAPVSAPVVVPVTPIEPTTEPAAEPTEEPVAEDPVAIVEPQVLIPGLPEAPADVEEVLEAWNPNDHPKKVLGIGVAAFTILTLLGPGGLALSSVAGAGMAGAEQPEQPERQPQRRAAEAARARAAASRPRRSR